MGFQNSMQLFLLRLFKQSNRHRFLVLLLFIFPLVIALETMSEVADASNALVTSTTCGGEFPAIFDATISSEFPAETFGLSERLQVSQANAGPEYMTLIGFDLNSLPYGTTIHQVILQLDVAELPYSRTDTFRVGTVQAGWVEDRVNWNNQPDILTSRSQAVTNYSGGILQIDVTTLVLSWDSRRASFYGLALMPGTAGTEVNFHSRETQNGGSAGPRLLVRCAVGRPAAVFDATDGDAAQSTAYQRLQTDSRLPLDISIIDGAVVSLDLALDLPPASGGGELEKARWFLKEYHDLFRLNDPDQELQYTRSSVDGDVVFFRQVHEGIPVFGSNVSVWVNDGAARYFNGSYLPDIGVAPNPRLSAVQAETIAFELSAADARQVGDTQLIYFNQGLFSGRREPTYLAWQVNLDVDGTVHHFYIDSESGRVLYRPPIAEDLQVSVYDADGLDQDYSCFVLSKFSDLKFTELGPMAVYIPSYIEELYDNYIDVYNYWKFLHNHISYDNKNGRMYVFGTVGIGWANARSNGDCLKFGHNWAVPDIVGHEFTHSVDSAHGKLVYMNESGALDESLADIFGYFADPEDWTLAEDTPEGTLRNLKFPAFEGQPEHYDDFVVLPADKDNDWGGVHTNSGIHNRAGYLIIDGGDYNGFSFPGLGNIKAGKLFYKLLTQGVGGGTTLKQAASMAIGYAAVWAEKGSYGFTVLDECSVRNAYASVGLTTDVDLDCDGIPDAQDSDADADGVSDNIDTCLGLKNPANQDTDKDGMGNACDDDDDNDGKPDLSDNCPLVENPGQEDWDPNGKGDHCEDTDLDTVYDHWDNCIQVANTDQSDIDNDGTGDPCDIDIDGDGILQFPYATPGDNCALVANEDQNDTDLDGHGDACDLCPAFSHPDNNDNDEDGIGDPCDPDDDNDGEPDDTDNCPDLYNEDQADLDQNGIGYACDESERTWWRQLNAHIFESEQWIPIDLPFRVDLPLVDSPCVSCGGPIIIHPGLEFIVDVNIGASTYARVLDSSGAVVAHAFSDGATTVNLSFEPAPFADIPAARAMQSFLQSGVDTLPHDRSAYYLEIIPLEDPNGDRTYNLDIAVSQGIRSYIPMTISN